MMVGRSCKINTCPFYVIQNTQRKRKIGSSKITTHIKAKESADVDVYINLIATRLSSRKGLFPYFFLIFSPFLKYFFIDRLYLYCC